MSSPTISAAPVAARPAPAAVTRSAVPAVVRPILAIVIVALALGGCGREKHVPTARLWVMAGAEPAFDPDGPPDARRWAIERLLTRGLLAEDDSGRIVPAAARAFDVSPDGRTYTFHLHQDLRYTGGARCGSADFRRALEAGLARRDHATSAWLLGAVRGVDQVRVGKPLPPLGIETPDDSTLVLRLVRPDSLLPVKLALPGVSSPWKQRAEGVWAQAEGLGPYRVLQSDAGRRLRLLRPPPRRDRSRASTEPDTVTIRFAIPGVRARSLMRSGVPDMIWPIPTGLLDEALPAGYRRATAPAIPERRLLLVMRADLPPTTRLPTRHALAHGLNRDELLRVLGSFGAEPAEWPRGGERFELPNLDPSEVERWKEQGKLGRSFHVVVAYDPDGLAGAAVRVLQEEWSRYAIYVELKPLRGRAFTSEALTARSHLLLVEAQSTLDHPGADLAQIVMPLRGPAVGSFRTGWRTREFDSFMAPGAPADSVLPIAQVKRRLEEELVALPLARLPWTWIERAPAAGESDVGCSRRYGPRWLSRRDDSRAS